MPRSIDDLYAQSTMRSGHSVGDARVPDAFFLVRPEFGLITNPRSMVLQTIPFSSWARRQRIKLVFELRIMLGLTMTSILGWKFAHGRCKKVLGVPCANKQTLESGIAHSVPAGHPINSHFHCYNELISRLAIRNGEAEVPWKDSSIF